MKKIDVGGQALIEGIMIKSPKYVSVGIRNSDGIKVKVEKFTSLTKRFFFNWLFIRGIVILIEMLHLGMKELIFSANEQVEEEEKESLGFWHILITIGVSLVFAILLFKAVPLAITWLIDKYITPINGTFLFNLIDGVIRISIFILYIYVISFLEDVKIMFRYHGAEHATISCYEHGEKLNVKNVKKHSTHHARCGTSFLVLTLIISILVFSLVSTQLPYWKLFLYRLPLILPIAGASYEILKLGDKFRRKWFFRQIIKPGLWVQNITTKKPNGKQIEVAIATLEALLEKHKNAR